MTNLISVTYGSKGYVASGEGGTLLHSEDGQKWKKVSIFTANDLMSITYCSGLYAATGILDTPEKSIKSHRRVYISHDAEKWSAINMNESLPLLGIACSNDGKIVVAGKKIFQSVLPKSSISK